MIDVDDDKTMMTVTMMINITALHRTVIKHSFQNSPNCQSIAIFTFTQSDNDNKIDTEQY